MVRRPAFRAPSLILTLVLAAAFWSAACQSERFPVTQPARLIQGAGGARVTAGDYTAIDLGSLGGSTNIPTGLNDSGRVVGYSSLADGRIHAFLWHSDTLTDLEQPSWFDAIDPETPAPYQSAAFGISNDGVIGGFAEESDGSLTPVQWRNGTTQNQSQTGFSVRSFFFESMSRTGDMFFLTSEVPDGPGNGFLTHAGAVVSTGSGIVGHADNASFQVVGRMAVADDQGAPVFHAFLMQGGAPRDLGVLAPATCRGSGQTSLLCTQSQATAINTQGDVVGVSNGFPVIWPGGGAPQQLASFTGVAAAINDHGMVAGERTDPPLGIDFVAGFTWQNGTAQDLGSLGGGHTIVRAMNQAGMIVGSSLTGAGVPHAFVWADGQLVDLATGPSGGTASIATGINERGDIIGVSGICRPPGGEQPGTCTFTSGSQRGVLWHRNAGPPPPPPPPPPPVVTVLALVPSAVTLDALDSLFPIAAFAKDQNGNSMSGFSLTWTSSDPNIVTVDATGHISGVSNGEAVVTAAGGTATASVHVLVFQAIAQVNVTPGDLTLDMHQSATLSVSAFDPGGSAVTRRILYAWSSSDPAVTVTRDPSDPNRATVIRERGHAAATITAMADGANGASATIGWPHGKGGR